jgi:hypothetical protein
LAVANGRQRLSELLYAPVNPWPVVELVTYILRNGKTDTRRSSRHSHLSPC